ncbi:MAG TPA: YbaL family putative K(+) efflux transporter [Gemmatimonadales bacterium]|jgi:CPA2 family monovalent cation:H+ antiporter-2|nr:YbaL family putative K(+) efflux transporter [Gemmatimonadales bacterium]
MPHDTTLILTIAAGLGFAFLFGFLAQRLGMPPLVGYLVAGIAVGPFSPGFTADTSLAGQLAEIGVILLMFGVGLHFSLGDLLAVRRIAVPGAVAQIAVASLLGGAVAHLWGWSWTEGLVFGLALSVASTVVLLRALEERGVLDSVDGRIAVGWLIVEDLATVLALVLLPALAAPSEGLSATLAITFGKVVAFLALMLVVGRRAVPWLLERVARTGSRELFTLCVLATALVVAVGAAVLFGVSFALGAFFAGVVINESDLSHQAASEALPLQDAFAVLFFVSVGMLFDPRILLQQPIQVLAVLAIVLFGKSLAAFAIVLLFRYPVHTALTISASLAQIGEFSFILAGLGASLGLLPGEGQSLIVAGALLSITLNPLMFALVGPVDRWIRARPRLLQALELGNGLDAAAGGSRAGTNLRDHAILVGHGRVGGTVGEAFARCGMAYLAIERDRRTVEALRERGVIALSGDATRPGILALARPEQARLLVVATPDPYQAREVIALARKANPRIDIVVRTHNVAEERYFEQQGVGRVVMGERELAMGMAHYALVSLGRTDDEADAVVAALREAARTPAQPQAGATR